MHRARSWLLQSTVTVHRKGDVAYNSLTSSPLKYKSRWSSLIFSSVDLKRSLLCWVSSVNYLTGYRVWKSAVVVVQTLGSEYRDVQRYPLTQMFVDVRNMQKRNFWDINRALICFCKSKLHWHTSSLKLEKLLVRRHMSYCWDYKTEICHEFAEY